MKILWVKVLVKVLSEMVVALKKRPLLSPLSKKRQVVEHFNWLHSIDHKTDNNSSISFAFLKRKLEVENGIWKRRRRTTSQSHCRDDVTVNKHKQLEQTTRKNKTRKELNRNQETSVNNRTSRLQNAKNDPYKWIESNKRVWKSPYFGSAEWRSVNT